MSDSAELADTNADDDFLFGSDLALERLMAELSCEKCNASIIGGGSETKNCRGGQCTVLFCINCGHEWASYGPTDCTCQRTVSRLHKMYHAKKRGHVHRKR